MLQRATISRRRMLTTIPALVGASLLPACSISANRVSDAAFARLKRGVNLSHWFAQDTLTPTRFAYFYQAADFEQIYQLGFRHVRVPIDPYLLLNREQPEQLNSKNLRFVDKAIDGLLAAKLAVIIDIHPQESWVASLKKDDATIDIFARFWQVLAKHFSSRDPGMVFLEAMNESHIEDAVRWEMIQKRLLTAMRTGAPQHTLIASGDDYSNIDALVKLTPIDDQNVIYNFHFYEPFIFTHQGATWGWSLSKFFRNLPYPSSPESVEAVIDDISLPEAQKNARYYGSERWNAEKIAQRIQKAVDWAKQHNVRLTCNEFGTYRRIAPADARTRWIQDVRTILEQHNIGWSMWDYSEGFGVAERNGDKLVIDPATVAALGLQV